MPGGRGAWRDGTFGLKFSGSTGYIPLLPLPILEILPLPFGLTL